VSAKNRLRSTFARYIGGIFICLLVSLLGLASCGKKQEQTEAGNDTYQDWQKYTYGHFVIHFSPNSRYLADKAGFARAYERFLTEISEMLDVPIPPTEDKIDLYVYSSLSELRNITGQEASFHDDSTIYWSSMRPSGYELTKFLMAKDGIPKGVHHVLSEGLANLLDFSGINYHDRTNRLVNSGKFVSLADLGDNAIFDTLGSKIQRSESASLTGFIMSAYGLERIIMLNASFDDWNTTIEALFNMDSKKFEDDWLKFARENSDNPAGTIENDTTQKVRIDIDGK
jgi:hypothetical protein